VPNEFLDKERYSGLPGWEWSIGLISLSHENSIVLSFRQQEEHCRQKNQNTVQEEEGEDKKKKMKKIRRRIDL
jgi:hypothetical protein